MFVGVESERYLKTLAQLGEGGPRQWWVRDCFEWKCEEIEQFEVAPHPAFSHLLPEGISIYTTLSPSI